MRSKISTKSRQMAFADNDLLFGILGYAIAWSCKPVGTIEEGGYRKRDRKKDGLLVGRKREVD